MIQRIMRCIVRLLSLKKRRMEKFNPYIRKQNVSWSIYQIKMLLNQIQRDNSSTFLNYAALECRIIIERLELAPLVMAASSLEDDSWKKELENFKGIQKLNSRLKSLRFRYQTFTVAFAEAIFENCPLVPFDYNTAETLQNKLAEYIHVYTKSDDDFLYQSEYVQQGIQLIKETLIFLENSCALSEGYYLQGIIDINTLSKEMKDEFNDWVNRKDENIKALTDRLDKIRQKNGRNKLTIK